MAAREFLEHNGNKFMDYASFEEGGITYKAWQPGDDACKRVWFVQALKDGVEVDTLGVPMLHPNIFGPDIDDIASLEAATEDFIERMKAKE